MEASSAALGLALMLKSSPLPGDGDQYGEMLKLLWLKCGFKFFVRLCMMSAKL